MIVRTDKSLNPKPSILNAKHQTYDDIGQV